ncbi:MAG: hypothetical protein FWC16_08645 [Defluviitaleaceae bacterium]|nr:hypothetical protein [Defluviitaleaceae bacterium]MCL2274979.1 hypothetical protein [Defluviitaleaceae bacterium]
MLKFKLRKKLVVASLLIALLLGLGVATHTFASAIDTYYCMEMCCKQDEAELDGYPYDSSYIDFSPFFSGWLAGCSNFFSHDWGAWITVGEPFNVVHNRCGLGIASGCSFQVAQTRFCLRTRCDSHDSRIATLRNPNC